jgi:hypothetical protein
LRSPIAIGSLSQAVQPAKVASTLERCWDRAGERERERDKEREEVAERWTWCRRAGTVLVLELELDLVLLKLFFLAANERGGENYCLLIE